MSILVRPVREQLEHDRVIRLLQEKWKRRFLVDANVGDERSASLKVGQMVHFPDLVFTSTQPPKRVQGIVEVETMESVNDLEASYQWANYGKARAPFFLYVPVAAIDATRRLVAARQVNVAELWSYVALGEQIHFNLVERRWTPPAGFKSEDVHAAPVSSGNGRPSRPKPSGEAPVSGGAEAAAEPSGAGAEGAPAGAEPVKARTAKPEGTSRKAAVAKKAGKAAKAAGQSKAGRVARPAKPAKSAGRGRGAAAKAVKAPRSKAKVKSARAARPTAARRPAKGAKPARPTARSAKAARSARPSKAGARAKTAKARPVSRASKKR